MSSAYLAGQAIAGIVELVMRGIVSVAEAAVLISKEEKKQSKAELAKKSCTRSNAELNVADLVKLCNWNAGTFPTAFCAPTAESLSKYQKLNEFFQTLKKISPEMCRDVRKFHDATFLYPYEQTSKTKFVLSDKDKKQLYNKLIKKRELVKRRQSGPDDASRVLSALQANAIMRNRMEKVHPLRYEDRNYYIVTPFQSRNEVQVYDKNFNI